jgi:hypothetical protein
VGVKKQRVVKNLDNTPLKIGKKDYSRPNSLAFFTCAGCLIHPLLNFH